MNSSFEQELDHFLGLCLCSDKDMSCWYWRTYERLKTEERDIDVVYQQHDAETKQAILAAHTAAVQKARQEPVGAALEIHVAPETMQAVLSRIKLKDENVARRVLEPLWRVRRWRDGSADEYDLEVEQWKLRILADLTTRKFNWAVFLLKPLKPDNLAGVYGRPDLQAQKGQGNGKTIIRIVGKIEKRKPAKPDEGVDDP